MSRAAQCAGMSPERLGKAFACLLEADPLVEGVSIVSVARRRQEEQAAPAPLRFPLQLAHQSLSYSTPTMKLVYDDRAELRRRLVVCNGEAGMEASESNNGATQLRNDDSVRAARRKALQPPANVVSRGRISKLSNQGCETFCVTRTRITDRDLHRCE
jgi:hypothetical protein